MIVKNKIQTLQDIVEYQLCCGCGACSYLHPDEIEMKDFAEYGRRPVFSESDDPTRYSDAFIICPGHMLQHQPEKRFAGIIESLRLGWGPVLEIWEGYAIDDEIRHKSSSGGAISAIALYCLEKAGATGVLQVTADAQQPHLNVTEMSNNRESIIAASGSRYSPASPCEKLALLEKGESKGVFVGKPCDVAAARNIAEKNKELCKNLFLTISCFCAGTPSTSGTREMLKQMGIENDNCLKKLRYRGYGWPGNTVADFFNGQQIESKEISYEKAWGDVLQKYRQWRCHICPDRTGEFADISAGDPWYKDTDDENGQSLILIRTPKGREIFQDALANGYLKAKKIKPELLPMSQVHLKNARARIWGQLLALKITRTPAPTYTGFGLKEFWQKELTLSGKIRSVLGTIRRVYRKNLNQRQKYNH